MRILCCSSATGDYIASTIGTVSIITFIGLIGDKWYIERCKIILYLANIDMCTPTSFANI
jgi:hypothetical protein